ncbi:MAG TPA: methyltransferase [Candidatus Hydrogenedentes bacterium]|nr:methyltransferase domain-containing protein [Candidatus Hydrogenedentota bacterium]HOV60546.1 methyltransferase [Candidatus Hydrogenedentota bacterium]
MPWLTFMKEVIAHNKTTGAFAPSSRELAHAVTDLAEVSKAGVIVEFGSGDGVFTEVILQKKRPDAFFMSLEINPTLAAAAKKRCPEALIIQDSAENVVKHLREAGHEHCDTIVSSLPWTRFEDDLQDRLLQAAWDALAPGGRFVTFAYAMSPYIPSGKRFFEGKLPARFGKIERVGPVWKNMPPSLVYMGRKSG